MRTMSARAVPASLSALPSEVMHLVLGQLPLLDVVRLQAVCAQMRTWAKDAIQVSTQELILSRSELGALMDDEALAAFLVMCPSLRVLAAHLGEDAAGGVEEADWVSDQSLEAAGRHCAVLQRLVVPKCPGVSGRGLTMLVRGGGGAAGTLWEVDLSGCSGVTDEGVVALCTEAKALTHLRIANTAVSTKAMAVVAERVGGRLRCFDASSTSGCKNETLQCLAEHCPGLEELQVHHCRGVWDAGIAAVARACAGLRLFDGDGLRAVTDEGVMALAKCKSLQWIRFGATRWITDDSIVALASAGLPLAEVSLHACPRLTDRSVEALAAGCPALRSINLIGIPCITDQSLVCLAASARCIREVSVGSQSRITDRGVSTLAEEAGERLTSLSCPNTEVSSRGLEAVGAHCSKLQRINCNRCKGVTDAGLKALAKGCPDLRHVNAAVCRLTGLGVRALAACLELRTLDVTACRIPQGLGAPLETAPLQAAITHLAKKCPRLDRVDSDFSLSFWQRDFSPAHALLIARRNNIRKGNGKL